MEIIKSVPENIQLSKDLSHQIPWSTGCLTPPWTPSRGVEVNSYSSMGFNLHRGRWQMPLLFTHWQCSWEVATCSWQFTLIHGPNIPGSYAILFFTVWYFTSTTSHVEYHQIANTKIKLITFFVAKDGEVIHSQEKQDLELTVTRIIRFS